MADSHVWRIKRGGNIAAVVFVHGLSGQHRRTWAEFPHLVLEDSELNHCDVVCWGYPTSLLRPLLPGLRFVGRRYPDLKTVADALRSDLLNPRIAGTYRDLVLVGHSMGGIVIQKAVIDAFNAPPPARQLSEHIRHIVLFATPSRGIQIPKVLKVHPQAKALRCGSELLEEIRAAWSASVSKRSPIQEPGASDARGLIPVTAVVGTEDNAVPPESARADFDDVETAPGSHTEVCKPTDREHTSFQVLKRVLDGCTVSNFISGADSVVRANERIVGTAEEVLFASGSRSRDESYLRAIESSLRQRPRLVYYRVLLGPPRHQALKDHLERLFEIRSPLDRSQGFKTLHIALYNDLSRVPENMFLCGNERECLLVLPSPHGFDAYDTAVVFTRTDVIEGYLQVVKQLYTAGVRLEEVDLVRKLRIEPLPEGIG